MGKPYGHQYSFAGNGGTAGTMVCSFCHKPIDSMSEDWMHWQKTIKGDWEYRSAHRRCAPDQSGWQKLEAEREKHDQRYKDRLSRLRNLAGNMGVTDAHEFAELAAASLGRDLDDFYSY